MPDARAGGARRIGDGNGATCRRLSWELIWRSGIRTGRVAGNMAAKSKNAGGQGV